MAKSCIFHELIELSRDEESTVRIASLETLSDLLDFFDRSKSILYKSILYKSRVILYYLLLHHYLLYRLH